MSNPYDHIKHAGNHGDVLKHVVMMACIKSQQKKWGDRGLLFVDTHCGKGLYDLGEQVTDEYEKGIMLVAQNIEDEAPPPVVEYLHLVQEVDSFMQMYPGSPVIAERVLRDGVDEHRCCDFFVTELEGLQKTPPELVQADSFDPDPNAMAYFLPADSTKHPVVLIDPSYIDQDDFPRAKDLVERMLEVNMGATILLWFPLLHGSMHRYSFLNNLKEMAKKKCGRGYYAASLTIDKTGMQGSAVFVCNPTDDFDELVNDDVLDFLSRTLLKQGKSDYTIDQWMRKKPKCD